MPTDTSLVGGLTLPVPTGGQDSDLVDVGVSGLLDYLAHYLRSELNDKLDEMRGPVSSAAVTDVAPSTRLYPFDHDGTWARATLPAMWGWSSQARRAPEYTTLVHDAYRRVISIDWIFPALQVPDGTKNRAGLARAVEATFLKAIERNRHATWSYNGSALNEQVHLALGFIGWRLLDCEPGRYQVKPVQTQRRGQSEGGDGYRKEYHPAVKARFEVFERVQNRQLVVPDDVNLATTFELSTNELGGPDTVLVVEGVVAAT